MSLDRPQDGDPLTTLPCVWIGLYHPDLVAGLHCLGLRDVGYNDKDEQHF